MDEPRADAKDIAGSRRNEAAGLVKYCGDGLVIAGEEIRGGDKLRGITVRDIRQRLGGGEIWDAGKLDIGKRRRLQRGDIFNGGSERLDRRPE